MKHEQCKKIGYVKASSMITIIIIKSGGFWRLISKYTLGIQDANEQSNEATMSNRYGNFFGKKNITFTFVFGKIATGRLGFRL